MEKLRSPCSAYYRVISDVINAVLKECGEWLVYACRQGHTWWGIVHSFTIRAHASTAVLRM